MNYRNAHYIDATRINCEIEHPIYGWIPYTLDPADTDMTIDNGSLLAEMTKNGDVRVYIHPTQIELDTRVAAVVRAERDFRLEYEVDIIAGNALRWGSLTPEKQDEWATYRKDLLNIPLQSGFPHDVVWPTKPE